MKWQTPTRALVVDPDAGRPTLVGSHWKRREPEADDPWNEVVVTGVLDLGERGLELTVQPRSFGPTLSADPDSFVEAYARVEGEYPMEEINERLRAIEARQ